MRLRSLATAWLGLALPLLALLVPARVRADDWLAVLPACDAALARDVGPVFEIVYPRPGLPALVEAGQTLIARVRLPSPLTPPPGVQQERALRGFSAQLIGHAHAFGALAGQAPLDHAYPLEVVNVRPDGAASLVYRVSLPIPAWAAPGTYDLVLAAPGGNGRARSLVRVLGAGEPPRVAWSLAGDPPANAAVAAMPIDVFVRTGSGSGSVSGSDSSPVLDTRALTAALRIGNALWVIGDCESPHLSFADEVGSVLARERRARRSIAAPAAGEAPGYLAWQASARAQAWPSADALRLDDRGGALEIALGASLSHAAIDLLFAGGDTGVSASAGTLRFFPAGDLTATSTPVLVAQLQLASAGTARVQLTPRAIGAWPSVVADPLAPLSGDVVRARALGSGPAWRIAYRFDAQHTAFTASAAEHMYQALGVHRIEALAIAGDGAARRMHTSVRVVTAQHIGCRCQLAHAAAPSRASAGVAAVFLCVCGRRQVRERRNRARKARSSARPE